MDINEFIKEWGIGLTGGIATGKSTVAQIIRSLGYEVIDADQLARQAVEPDSQPFHAIVRVFGSQVLLADGSINRQALAASVFADPIRKKALEAILHPAIWRLLEKKLIAQNLIKQEKPWFYEAALLCETGSYQRFRSLWVTWCPPAIQLSRLMERNKITEAEALTLIQNQMPADEKKNLADLVLDTSGSLLGLESTVHRALNELLVCLQD